MSAPMLLSSYPIPEKCRQLLRNGIQELEVRVCAIILVLGWSTAMSPSKLAFTCTVLACALHMVATIWPPYGGTAHAVNRLRLIFRLHRRVCSLAKDLPSMLPTGINGFKTQLSHSAHDISKLNTPPPHPPDTPPNRLLCWSEGGEGEARALLLCKPWM